MSKLVEFSDEKPPLPEFPIRVWSNEVRMWIGNIKVVREELALEPEDTNSISLDSLEIVVRKMQKLKEQMKQNEV